MMAQRSGQQANVRLPVSSLCMPLTWRIPPSVLLNPSAAFKAPVFPMEGGPEVRPPQKKRRRAVESADELALVARLPDRVDAGGDGSAGVRPAPKKAVYTEAERLAMLEVYEAVGTKKKAVRILRRKAGYGKVTPTHLRLWERQMYAAPRNPPGRPRAVFADFEAYVMEGLPAGADTSYSDVRDAINRARALPHWSTDVKLQRLKLSDQWISRMLQRTSGARVEVSGDAAGHAADPPREDAGIAQGDVVVDGWGAYDGLADVSIAAATAGEEDGGLRRRGRGKRSRMLLWTPAS